MFDVRVGDCRDRMKEMDACSVDSIVTDPPYGISFMGKGWDHGVPGVEFWEEALRVAKPGAHLLAFGGTRTFHRLTVAIEDAGWDIRDCVMWVYGSGFPKSLDVSKAVDKQNGFWRGKAGDVGTQNNSMAGPNYSRTDKGKPITDAAKEWSGWGTALKPAWEPIIVARKPLVGTVAENVLEHGTGALNVDGCRVGVGTGRWPANLIHDGSEEVVELFPESKSGQPRDMSGYNNRRSEFAMTGGSGGYSDCGSAARFFYCAKASKSDRDAGCEALAATNDSRKGNGLSRVCAACGQPQLKPCKCGAPWILPPVRNHHPTVKPTDLMRYLCRMVTPPKGVILDPFSGSGSTGKGAVLEGFDFIGIELSEDYATIARARIADADTQQPLL